MTPPIIVEYDVSPSPAVLSPGEVAFASRLARLVNDVDRADVHLSVLDPPSKSSSFLLADAGPVSSRELATAFPNASFADIRAATGAALSRALLAEGFREGDSDIVRDYDAPCPSGWLDRGDGDACDAPVSYEGPCGGTLHFGGLAAHEKMDIANSCGVMFASVGACARDFFAPCPTGWRLGSSNVCNAPVDYAGPCVRRKVFSSMVAADRAWFENMCGVQWPCRASWASSLRPSAPDACDEDFSKPCPRTWADVDGVCLAPAAYDGPCSVVWAAAGYTSEEKRVVSRDCGAPWPCSI